MKKSEIKKLVDEKGLGCLRRFGFSDTAILIIDRLEYWFEQYPDGFDKHTTDCADQKELPGECWVKELGISRPTFKKYFAEIGVIYTNPEDALALEFQANYYYSVLLEGNNRRTMYMRNHQKAKRIQGYLRFNRKLMKGFSKKTNRGKELVN
jgi:hypothetical protein